MKILLFFFFTRSHVFFLFIFFCVFSSFFSVCFVSNGSSFAFASSKQFFSKLFSIHYISNVWVPNKSSASYNIYIYVCVYIIYWFYIYKSDDRNRSRSCLTQSFFYLFQIKCPTIWCMVIIYNNALKCPGWIRMRLNLKHIHWSWLNALWPNEMLLKELFEMTVDVALACSNQSLDGVLHVYCEFRTKALFFNGNLLTQKWKKLTLDGRFAWISFDK